MHTVVEANGAEKSDGSSKAGRVGTVSFLDVGDWEGGKGVPWSSSLPVEQPTRDGVARAGCWTSKGLSPDSQEIIFYELISPVLEGMFGLFCFITALLRYNWHATKLAFLNVQCSGFSIHTESCNHYHHLIQEHFHHPKKKFHIHWQSLPLPLVPGDHSFTLCLFGFASSR